jgi:hypothetical protein
MNNSILSSKPNRLYFLDWLRVLGVIGVFLYHNALPYIPEQWRIVNSTQSTNIYLATLLFQPLGMPLLFLLAGATTWFALKKRSPKQYVIERFKRLVIPFIIGSIILVPPQRYFTSVHHGLFHGTFLKFLGQYFSNTNLLAILVAKWVKVAIFSGSSLGSSEPMRTIAMFRDTFGAWRGSTIGMFCIELIRSLFVLSSILALLFVGKKFLNFRNRFLDYANEAVLPFYSIHQAVIVMVAFYVIQWHDSILVKYVTIGVSSFIITLLIFEVFIRRLNPARAVFGLRQRWQPTVARSTQFIEVQPAERSNRV